MRYTGKLYVSRNFIFLSHLEKFRIILMYKSSVSAGLPMKQIDKV